MCPQRPPLSLRALLGILILATSLIGCVSSETTRGGGDSTRHDSPQAAYDAAKAATKAKDYSAFSDCLTPESQDMMSGGMIRQSLMMKEIAVRGGPEGEQDQQDLKASCRALDDVLAKHGLNQDQLQAIQAIDLVAVPPEEGMAALAKLTTPIKDKSAFLVEIMNTMDAMESAYTGKQGGMGKNKTTGMFEGRLENIKVEGDRATAQVVVTEAGEEQRWPIGFKNVNGNWLIELIVPGRM